MTSSPSPQEGYGPTKMSSDQVRCMCACLCSFSSAVIKHHDPGNLKKQEFMWAHCSRGSGVCYDGETWRQGVDMAAGSGSRVHTLNQSVKQRGQLKMAGALQLSKRSPGMCFTSRATPPKSPKGRHQQLSTKCSNT